MNSCDLRELTVTYVNSLLGSVLPPGRGEASLGEAFERLHAGG